MGGMTMNVYRTISPARKLILGMGLLLLLLAAAAIFWQSGRGKAAPVRHLYLVSQNGRWGYMDAAGRIQIQPRYEFATEFSEGRAAVMAEGYWGVIDELGNQIVPRQYDEIRPFQGGLAVAGRGGRYGYIDRDGHEVAEPQFDYATDLSDGMGMVSRDGLTSFATDDKVFPAIKAGALGYLLKDSRPEELLEAIRRVHQGEPSLSPVIAASCCQRWPGRLANRPPPTPSPAANWRCCA